ncbi:MAG TPA: hypothetical protein VK898_00165, partial [Chloroflexota bacterium]|nr:hypothetical protein [Chloroflexota bacterium]
QVLESAARRITPKATDRALVGCAIDGMQRRPRGIERQVGGIVRAANGLAGVSSPESLSRLET